MRGVELRVGSKSRLDQEISTEVMQLLMKKIELAVKGKVSMLEMRDLTKRGAYFMSYFVATLRGSEGFMMDAAGLRHHIGKVKECHLANVVTNTSNR